MGYHDLSECTLNADERLAEKDRICRRLDQQVCSDEFTPSELEFITKITDSNFVSVKQLFWLRDINAKY
jgi:hypothetical protein